MSMMKAVVRLASTRTISQVVCQQTRCASNEYRDLSQYYFDAEKPKYEHGKHRSNALELLEKQPVIEVEGERAICDGGGGSLGHPIEYISLERPGAIKGCVYCGLKFKSKPH